MVRYLAPCGWNTCPCPAHIPQGLVADLALNNAAKLAKFDAKTRQRQKQTQLTTEVSIANQDIGFVNAGQLVLIDGKRIALSPGMNITAEIKTGKRRVIGFSFSPVRGWG